MKLYLPTPSTSPTAVQDKSDYRDENIYSAIVLQHGGVGQQSLFTVPKGQAIPRLAGTGITAPASAHQLNYTDLTTNITQAGQLGSAIGDVSVRGIGLTIENAYFVNTGATAGLQNTAYGAGQQEVSEILSKVFFQFLIAGKKQVQGAAWMFPASGGAFGSLSVSNTTATTGNVAAAMSNGWPGNLRRLKLPVLVARTDTVEGIVGVAGGAALVFSTTTGTGQPTLLWANLHCLVSGDAR